LLTKKLSQKLVINVFGLYTKRQFYLFMQLCFFAHFILRPLWLENSVARKTVAHGAIKFPLFSYFNCLFAQEKTVAQVVIVFLTLEVWEPKINLVCL